MTTDPRLDRDKCIYAESTSGDHGNHNPHVVWWLSNDIALNKPVPGAPPDPEHKKVNEAYPKPLINKVSVTVRCKEECVPVDETVTLEVYVGNPYLAMKPNNARTVTRILNVPDFQFEEFQRDPTVGGLSATKGFTWEFNPNNDPNSPEHTDPHRCLIVRCYPQTLDPDDADFHLPDDPHVIQRNIAIMEVPRLDEGQVFEFDVLTTNLNEKEHQLVTIRAEADLDPDEHVRIALAAGLEAQKHYIGEFASDPKIDFGLRLPDFDAKVIDRTGGEYLPPRYDALIELQPGQTTKMFFSTSLINFQPGRAHVFHLSQIGDDARAQGGMTLVIVPYNHD